MFKKWLVCLTLSLISLQALPCFAQRGGESITQEEPISTPVSSFPGYFDSNVVPKGKSVMQVPLMTMDVGLTENLTVGTSGIPLGFMAMTRVPVAYAKARYRLYSDEHVAVSLTGYFGGIWDSKLRGQSYLLTQNTSWIVDRYNVINFHTSLVHINSAFPGSLVDGYPGVLPKESYELSLTSILPGLSYQHFFSDTFGMEALVLVPAKFNLSVNNFSYLSKVTGHGIPGFHFRVLAHIKTSQKSVFSFGIGGIQIKYASGIIPLLGWETEL